MKICFFGYTLATSPGGCIQYTRAFACSLLSQGHEVTIVTVEPEESAKIVGVEYYSLLSRKKKATFFGTLVFSLKAIYFFIKHREFDVIHAMSSYHSYAHLVNVVRVITSIPIVYTVFSPTSQQKKFARFKEIICVSENVQKSFTRTTNLIPSCIDLEEFKEARTYPFRQKSSLIIGTLGGPTPRKGFMTLVQAMPSIISVRKDTLFVFACELKDVAHDLKKKEELLRMKQLIRDNGLEDHALFLGEVDVPVFMNSLDFFVYPVKTTKGMIDISPAILEALAAGVVVMTTDTGAASEVVTNNQNGILVPPSKKECITTYVRTILELCENPEKKKAIQRQAKYSVERYDVKNAIPKLLEVYKRAVA